MDVHQFYFWIPICTVWSAEEGGNAFTHLVMHRRPLTAAYTQIFFSSLMLSGSQSDSRSISVSLSNPILTAQSNAL